MTGQMAAFYIRRRFFRHFHHKRELVVGEISQKRLIQMRTQIIAVGNKGIGNSIVQQ